VDAASTRRRFLTAMAGALATAAPLMTVQAEGVQLRDVCYWRRAEGPMCSGGRIKEYWCEYCNTPGSGVTPVRCEWRRVGQC
jgi:hypothetical protein